MSKNIAISDEVYDKLKREKGDRSFSEVIEEKMTGSGKLADVAGQRIFEEGTLAAIKGEVERLSDGTVERVENETS